MVDVFHELDPFDEVACSISLYTPTQLPDRSLDEARRRTAARSLARAEPWPWTATAGPERSLPEETGIGMELLPWDAWQRRARIWGSGRFRGLLSESVSAPFLNEVVVHRADSCRGRGLMSGVLKGLRVEGLRINGLRVEGLRG